MLSRQKLFVALLAFFSVGFFTDHMVQAGPVYLLNSSDPLVPAGLNPGDQFHIIFVTHGSTNAASSNISDYDNVAFIQANAIGNIVSRPGLNWKAVVSTSSVSANAHTAVSAPVYLPTHVLVATGFVDLWDGSIAHAIDINQFGNVELGFGGAVFTGTNVNGFGSNPLGTSPAKYGRYTASSGAWIEDGAVDPSNSFPIYAISEVIEVASPPAVPEPSSMILMGIGIVAAIGLRTRRQSL